MDATPRKDTLQATAAATLAAVAAELQQAAAAAVEPTEQLVLMRQLRKVQAAHEALVHPEAINTQSIPVQAPAPKQAPAAAAPAGFWARLQARLNGH